MARIVALNALKGGINRLRTKGGADPSSLYDLVNAFVTIDGSIQSRPGTVRSAALPAGTKGLCAFDGGMVVFSNVSQTMPAGYTCEVLVNPNDATQAIAEIHFAAPFMGSLYVVAEFANGDVYHYWLNSSGTWQALTMYKGNAVITPTVSNGLRYRAVATVSPPAWQPSTTYAVGDVVQPTVYTGWKFTVTEADGASPTSGTTEPTWPETDGAQVVEYLDTTPAGGSTPSPPAPGPGGGRYDNGPGVNPNDPRNTRTVAL